MKFDLSGCCLERYKRDSDDEEDLRDKVVHVGGDGSSITGVLLVRDGSRVEGGSHGG